MHHSPASCVHLCEVKSCTVILLSLFSVLRCPYSVSILPLESTLPHFSSTCVGIVTVDQWTWKKGFSYVCQVTKCFFYHKQKSSVPKVLLPKLSFWLHCSLRPITDTTSNHGHSSADGNMQTHTVVFQEGNDLVIWHNERKTLKTMLSTEAENHPYSEELTHARQHAMTSEGHQLQHYINPCKLTRNVSIILRLTGRSWWESELQPLMNLQITETHDGGAYPHTPPSLTGHPSLTALLLVYTAH